MRIFLMFLNLLLTGGLIGAVTMLFDSSEPEKTPVVKKSGVAKSGVAKSGPAVNPVSPAVRSRSDAEAAALLQKNNPFGSGRAPAATPWNGRGRNQSELTLVGTFALGDARGAVILQKARNNDRRQNLPGMPPMPPGMSQPNSNTKTVQPRQYIRVGETLDNGYTLVEVGADYAVLSRNGGRTELKLQEASKNQPATTRPMTAQQQRANQFRQYQQMQMMQQMGMMNMMRQMMQMRNQSNRNQRGGGNFGGGQVVGGGSRRGGATGGLNTGGGLNL